MKNENMKTHNEYGDKLAGYELSMLAKQAGIDVYTPECWTRHPEKGWIIDEWTGLIGEPHELECYRHTLSNLQSLLRDKLDMFMIVHITEDLNFYVTINLRNHTHSLYNNYEEALEKGLEEAFREIIENKDN